MDMPSANRHTDAVLDEIVRRLVAIFQPERIYLFGSRARGDAGPDSDYDLLMVLDQLDEPSYHLAQRAHSLLWGLGTAADILVWSREAFDSRLHVRGCPALPRMAAALCPAERPAPGQRRLRPD